MSAKTRLNLAVALILATFNVAWAAPKDDDEPEDSSGRVYRWVAIGCGAAINIIIGGYAGLTNILETGGRWTQRLEFVKDESKWWTWMSSIVLIAFAMDVVAFSKGESVDATILLLAAEVGIVIFVYVIQGTIHSEYRYLLWLAWSGKSRTGSDLADGAKITDVLAGSQDLKEKVGYESNVDIPGYGTVFSQKTKQDVIAVLKKGRETDKKTASAVFEHIGRDRMARNFVYPQHQADQSKASILWGGGDCKLFSRRVSRGITGYTLERIRSSYSLINVDETRWMFVAGGIVARNKGLYPALLICGLTKTGVVKGVVGTEGITTIVPNTLLIDEVETTSKWRPRPAKTSRSLYVKESVSQFSGLGQPYCAAVVEMALLLQDVPNDVVIKALNANVEQQSSQKMWDIYDLTHSMELQNAMYVCQYMAFCAKLNWYG
ncbi:hypothetical protein BGW38_009985 [Lunasporangiospora selenospora]|uniref:Uncharacterized protein n=1 Tax=Lunasporangiospora selenospora TaxID=979761 RepID=A0A9P6G4G6_9FUNG|nr:hypothetical protein BGW38_009985 [Lunasporangiospora selenospora]